MRPVILSLVLAVAAGAASAGGVTFSLPSVHFPPNPDIVTQDCIVLPGVSVETCETSK